MNELSGEQVEMQGVTQVLEDFDGLIFKLTNGFTRNDMLDETERYNDFYHDYVMFNSNLLRVTTIMSSL